MQVKCKEKETEIKWNCNASIKNWCYTEKSSQTKFCKAAKNGSCETKVSWMSKVTHPCGLHFLMLTAATQWLKIFNVSVDSPPHCLLQSHASNTANVNCLSFCVANLKRLDPLQSRKIYIRGYWRHLSGSYSFSVVDVIKLLLEEI